MKKLHLILLLILSIQFSAFSQFKLLKDVNPDHNGGGPSPSYAEANGEVYFALYRSYISGGDGSTVESSQKGLWKTNGTLAGTVRVKTASLVSDITNANGTVFFTAKKEGASYRVLWKSDGTDAGTVMVKDISFGNAETTLYKNYLTAVNQTVFFVALIDGSLWKSDGTDAGTVMVKNGLPGSISELKNINGVLYFSCNGLWKSDGTAAGTVQVSTTTAAGITDFNGTAVFRGNTGQPTDGLWKSDGTAAGTVRISSFLPSHFLSVIHNKIVFANGTNIWSNDGTLAGTTNIFTMADPINHIFLSIKGYGSIGYFTLEKDPGDLHELWKMDGTAGGTLKVKDLAVENRPNLLAVVNGILLFLNYDAATGFDLWKSDGTSGGTVMLKDIYQGVGGGTVSNFFVSNGLCYFSANDGLYGPEIWKSDGTIAGTELLKDIISPTGSSNPDHLFKLNNTLIFAASDLISRAPNPPIGHELFRSDGTTSGTSFIKDIGEFGSNAGYTNFTLFNNQLFFSATDGGPSGRELYSSDATTAGTKRFKDINPSTVADRASNPDWLTVSNNTLFFSASNGATVNGAELWKSDGTIGGTVMVKDINPGTGNSSPSWLTNVNGVLFFSADDGDGKELWKSDGTAAGTVKLTDHPFGGSPTNLININGTLFYSYTSGNIFGTELCSSDGTPGINAIKDIKPLGSSNPTSMTNFNGTLFFVADGGNEGVELWKSDGTDAGTVMVKDIVLGTGSSNPQSLTVVNGSLYFTADDGINGRELWKTDGTDAGTVMVKDVNVGASSNPAILANIGFRLYFAANDGINGNEIWVTDGTPDGTTLVQDIQPGAGSSDPSEMVEVNGKIFVSVYYGPVGRELWIANTPNDSPLPLTLLEFKGSLVNDNGVLQWKTDNELNTKSFAIERSTDGRNYSTIGHITAANASGIHVYDYTDANIKSLGASIVYYRLRQVDADNKFTYSRIVALSIDNKKNFAMLYPNPVKSEINLTITLAKKERLNWQLIDNNGRTIKSGYYTLSAGSTSLSIEASNISSGSYIMHLKGETLQQTIKVIKQ